MKHGENKVIWSETMGSCLKDSFVATGLKAPLWVQSSALRHGAKWSTPKNLIKHGVTGTNWSWINSRFFPDVCRIDSTAMFKVVRPWSTQSICVEFFWNIWHPLTSCDIQCKAWMPQGTISLDVQLSDCHCCHGVVECILALAFVDFDLFGSLSKEIRIEIRKQKHKIWIHHIFFSP